MNSLLAKTVVCIGVVFLASHTLSMIPASSGLKCLAISRQ